MLMNRTRRREAEGLLDLITHTKPNELEERIKKTLKGVKHPESGRNIVELGMVRGIEVKGERVKFTLAFPFLDVAIKDRLVAEARRAVEELPGVGKVAVELTEMTQKERAHFMAVQEGKPVEGPNRIEHVVAVMSGKGGVGKSLVSGLLAIALRRKGLEVGLTGPSIPKMFFKEQRRPDEGKEVELCRGETEQDLPGVAAPGPDGVWEEAEGVEGAGEGREDTAQGRVVSACVRTAGPPCPTRSASPATP
ncbi:MAG TPA: DUF59 domain-containing protein [Candidatus Latescibacteria bacterium]|nr:DUF59 domain-containing protein [Candidatus Latescibacterota bacterium]